MKHILPTMLFLFLATIGHSQTSQEALDYLEEVSNGQRQITEQLMGYISVSTHSNNPNKIETKRQKLLKVTDRYRNKVEEMDAFYGDVSLRNAIIKYYDLCYQSLSDEYKYILQLKDKANSDYEIMKSMLEAEEEAAAKFDGAQERVQNEFQEFADKYDITLIETEEDALTQMISKSNEVNNYYNKIFLPMFKVNIQNVRLKEVLQSNDIEEITKQKQLVIDYAGEARTLISNMTEFDGDDSLIEAALERVDYYEKEAVTMADSTIEYVELSKLVAEKDHEISAIQPKKRTKEMVDNYNALIQQVNQKANELNKNVDQFNQVSQQEIIQWQELVEAFRKRHIPKYGLFEQQA